MRLETDHPLASTSGETREAALSLLRTRIMPALCALDEELQSVPADNALLTTLTALGNALDALSPQHPALYRTLDALHKASLTVAAQVCGTTKTSDLPQKVATKLKPILPRVKAIFAAHKLTDYHAAVALLQATIALTIERDSDFPALSDLRDRELLPLSTELLAYLVSPA